MVVIVKICMQSCGRQPFELNSPAKVPQVIQGKSQHTTSFLWVGNIHRASPREPISQDSMAVFFSQLTPSRSGLPTSAPQPLLPTYNTHKHSSTIVHQSCRIHLHIQRARIGGNLEVASLEDMMAKNTLSRHISLIRRQQRFSQRH